MFFACYELKVHKNVPHFHYGYEQFSQKHFTAESVHELPWHPASLQILMLPVWGGAQCDFHSVPPGDAGNVGPKAEL